MKATRMFMALNALLAAILACNLPGGQRPAQLPDLAGTITAQAVLLMESNSTSSFPSIPALTDTPLPMPIITSEFTPSVPQVSVTAATNCRTGPGTQFDVLYTLQPGQIAEIIGKDVPDDYWVIKMPNGGTCWLWGQYAVVTGNAVTVPEYPLPPTPTPSLPATPSGFHVSYQCALNSSPFMHIDVHVNITWDDNATHEGGYYIFRDGTLLATLDANATSFADDTTMAAIILAGRAPPHITYELQAFNPAGTSKKASKSISCFD